MIELIDTNAAGIAGEFVAARLRAGSPAQTWPVAVGAARGMLDFLRGRWGPPPPLPAKLTVTSKVQQRRILTTPAL